MPETQSSIPSYPNSVREWERYINNLSGRKLWDQARAANQIRFVRLLEEDGFRSSEITQVFRLFAQRFIDTGSVAPGRFDGHYINYRDLIDELQEE